MSDAEFGYLGKRWGALCDALGVGKYRGVEVLQDLLIEYSKPHRHYHTLDHIRACIRLLHTIAAYDSNLSHIELQQIEMALWWHDFVYDPRRVDNEERSVSAFWIRAADMKLQERFCIEVLKMIRGTEHLSLSRLKSNMPLPQQYMLDIDLSILGADPETFDKYERDIRAEYAFVPEDRFREGRAEVLQSFANRDRIYLTQAFHNVFEAQARQNIARSLADLNSKVGEHGARNH